MNRMVFFVPSDRPVGGIAKVLDYAVHARRQGREVVFCCSDMQDAPGESALFHKPYYQQHGAGMHLCDRDSLDPRPDDILFFTLPSSYEQLCILYGSQASRMNFIHLMQNVRLSNMMFDKGFSFRLLAKPIHRLCITQEVVNAVAPYVENRDQMLLIPHGFDFDAFDCAPKRDDPISITFNTFKGEIGRQIVRPFNKDPRVHKIWVSKKGISWNDLQRNYRKASIFLSTPLAEEGLYLPGLEAMAAGQIVITPDAYGNRFYCDFDKNCLQVELEDIAAYQDRIEWTIANWEGEVFDMRCLAYEKATGLGLDSERALYDAWIAKAIDNA